MSKKILFIGVLAEKSGWGEASRGYLKALNKTGLDIVARVVKPNPDGPDFDFDDEIKSLLNKPTKDTSGGPEICIQHVLPHMMRYNGNYKKNIGIFVTETGNWYHSGWHHYLNLMDELWVPNKEMFYQVSDNKIKLEIPVHHVPHAFDISKYHHNYDKPDLGSDNSNYKFYFIGENSRRKRLGAFIQAFHLTFRRNEPVSLIIKTNGTLEKIEQICNEIKTGLKIYGDNSSYQQELIITNRISEEELMGLHLACDCFVNSSYGEAWCIPAFDAMAFGNQVISTKSGGPMDFLSTYEGGHLIEGHSIPVIGATDTFNFLNTGHETWRSIDIMKLSQKMRQVYELDDREKDINGLKIASKYSIENIGKIMKGILECS